MRMVRQNSQFGGFEYCIYRKMKINDRKDDRLEATVMMLLSQFSLAATRSN